MMDDFNINRYLINYTQLSKARRLTNLVGRQEELERLIHILMRSTKCNPAVIGASGIGKTALIEGLINFLASDGVPDSLNGREVVGIDIPKVMLDTKSEAEYSELLKQIIQTVVDSDKQKILYLKDVSLLVNMDTNPENKEAEKFFKLCL